MPRIAVLIDADNISASFAQKILAHTSRLGSAMIKRAYGKAAAMTDWERVARDEAFELRLQNNLSAGKNGADIALAVDAMDILHGSDLQSFCIVSNDRDFVPLATRLRASGRSVHAICKQADERYAKAFDSILELAPPMHPIVDAFLKLTAGREPELSLGEAGKLLRQHLPGVIPTSGKAPLRKALELTGKFAFVGDGSAMRVRLVG